MADGTAPAPFLRIPGLRVNDGIEEFAASKGLQLWSADFPADDWRNVSANRVYELAMQRLEQKGKGILLLHDIQPRTVAALPRILRELKARGYRIVHVVPATPDRPATPTEPQQWQLHPPSEMVAISRWPKIPKFAFAGPAALPVPALSDLDWHTTDLGVRAPRRGRGVPLPPAAPWPRQTTLPPAGTLAALPVPAASLFKFAESARMTLLASSHAPGGDCAGPFNGSLLRKARRQISPPRPRGRGPAAGVSRRNRARAAKRWRDHPQAGGASQTERAIGSGRRVEEALIGRL